MKDEIAIRATAYAVAAANLNAAKAQVDLARKNLDCACALLGDAHEQEQKAAVDLLTVAAGGKA